MRCKTDFLHSRIYYDEHIEKYSKYLTQSTIVFLQQQSAVLYFPVQKYMFRLTISKPFQETIEDQELPQK